MKTEYKLGNYYQNKGIYFGVFKKNNKINYHKFLDSCNKEYKEYFTVKN